jgi:site-specific DNA-methyltransferase (adenine-specific)
MEIRRKNIMNIDLRQGDCLEVLKTIPDNSIDSVVTDPPYHLTSSKGDKKGFMGKDWDGGDIAFRTDVWSECYRVLKPGGHLLAFSHSRTYHRMAVAIEDSGFDIRDQIMWIYGSGFPKSHNIGKAIDKIEGNEREVLEPTGRYKYGFDNSLKGDIYGNYGDDIKLTKGSSDWEGWGTALKPAHEPIVMARKPLSEKSIAENVIKWGTGGINIDECRIPTNWEDERPPSWFNSGKSKSGEPTYGGNLKTLTDSTLGERLNDGGRFPANIMFDDDTDEDWKRYFYCPKVSKKERNTGLDNFEEKVSVLPGRNTFDENGNRLRVDGSIIPPLVSKNHHPTVKPLKLMEYLIKLVTPKGGVVMDCFMGSGSTGVAARNLGFKFIGIEREQEYMDIAKQRITQPVQTKLDI